MSDVLEHRGPDDSGVWVDAERGVGLGHRRLAIVDLSPAGHQPMLSATGRYVIAFNGEIYNFRALGQELSRRGHSFRGHSDTEVILAAVTEWGLRPALERFIGMFAFALWDRERSELHLCRDRFGEKPLYYGWSGEQLLFGSELKALRAHPDWRGDVDRGALTLYMRYCYVPAPYSIYEGIRKLTPGTTVTFRHPSVGQLPDPVPYWSVKSAITRGLERPFAGTEEEAADELEALLRDAVGGQMVADVPLGAFLSGGVDSSTIVALMQSQSAQPVRTFTIGFHESAYNEAEHARSVAAVLRTDHTELYVTPAETLDVIPRLPTIYDEPFADSSQIPTFLLSQMTRKSVTVSLSGDAGDEIFGGYIRYFLGPRIWQRMAWIPGPGRRAMGRMLAAVPPHRWDAMLNRWGWMIPSGLRQARPAEKIRKLAAVMEASGPDAIYKSLVSSWAFPESAVTGGWEPSTLLSEPQQWPRFDSFADRMMYLDAMTYLPDDILVKVDRAAMATSLETRVPFLDHRVMEFAARLPRHFKIQGGEGKRILRRILYRHVPKELIERPKMGFGVPVDLWLRGPLREWAEELLDEKKLREGGLLNPAPIRRCWMEHVSGQANWSFHLWCVLMFQAWLEETRIAPGAGVLT